MIELGFQYLRMRACLNLGVRGGAGRGAAPCGGAGQGAAYPASPVGPSKDTMLTDLAASSISLYILRTIGSDGSQRMSGNKKLNPDLRAILLRIRHFFQLMSCRISWSACHINLQRTEAELDSAASPSPDWCRF